jgi:membrane protease YdiL (CAAX protease family)
MEPTPPAPLPAGPEEPLPPGHLYRMAWGLYLILAVAGGVWIGIREGSIALSLFFDSTSWGLDLAGGAAAGGVLLLAWELGRRTLRLARELEAQLGRVLGSIDSQEALALAVLSGFAEELFFRGAVQGAFGSHGWLWAALLFALLHTGPGRAYRLWSLFALVAGVVFGLLTVWSGNLLAAVVAHTLVNAVNLGRLARKGRRWSEGAKENGEARAETGVEPTGPEE